MLLLFIPYQGDAFSFACSGSSELFSAGKTGLRGSGTLSPLLKRADASWPAGICRSDF
jgi:hypothetical protein